MIWVRIGFCLAGCPVIIPGIEGRRPIIVVAAFCIQTGVVHAPAEFPQRVSSIPVASGGIKLVAPCKHHKRRMVCQIVKDSDGFLIVILRERSSSKSIEFRLHVDSELISRFKCGLWRCPRMEAEEVDSECLRLGEKVEPFRFRHIWVTRERKYSGISFAAHKGGNSIDGKFCAGSLEFAHTKAFDKGIRKVLFRIQGDCHLIHGWVKLRPKSDFFSHMVCNFDFLFFLIRPKSKLLNGLWYSMNRTFMIIAVCL